MEVLTMKNKLEKIYAIQQLAMNMRESGLGSDSAKILVLDLVQMLADESEGSEKTALQDLYDFVVTNL